MGRFLPETVIPWQTAKHNTRVSCQVQHAACGKATGAPFGAPCAATPTSPSIATSFCTSRHQKEAAGSGAAFRLAKNSAHPRSFEGTSTVIFCTATFYVRNRQFETRQLLSAWRTFLACGACEDRSICNKQRVFKLVVVQTLTGSTASCCRKKSSGFSCNLRLHLQCLLDGFGVRAVGRLVFG